MTPYEFKLKELQKEAERIPNMGGLPSRAIAQFAIRTGRVEFEAAWKMQFDYEPDDYENVVKLTTLLKERGLIE